MYLTSSVFQQYCLPPIMIPCISSVFIILWIRCGFIPVILAAHSISSYSQKALLFFTVGSKVRCGRRSVRLENLPASTAKKPTPVFN